MKKVSLTIALLTAIVLLGCTGGGGKSFTDVGKVEKWLASQKGGASVDDPIPFSVKLNLQNMASPESNWQKLLAAINTAGLYVALDLSGCTMPTTEFNADGGTKTGKQFIVSLVLPDSAKSVEGVLYKHFGNLKTAKARNIDYFVGDIGPAGGIVFYGKGDSADGWRYLEAAPAKSEFSDVQWGAYDQDVAGTETDVGTGKRNTELIVAQLKGETSRAAQVCDMLEINGFSDWFLPSMDELDLMYRNLKLNNIGGLGNSYWSSSQNNDRLAWSQLFNNGFQYGYGKYWTSTVRAIRAF